LSEKETKSGDLLCNRFPNAKTSFLQEFAHLIGSEQITAFKRVG